MLSKELIDLTKAEAQRKNLRLDLVLAIIEVESAGNTFAMRYEKAFLYYYRPEFFAKSHLISLETERCLQRFSYGLMQIMGGTARYRGFQGKLIELLNPSVGILWGCQHLRKICDEYLVLEDQISIYNAGKIVRTEKGFYRNQLYVNKVLLAMAKSPAGIN